MSDPRLPRLAAAALSLAFLPALVHPLTAQGNSKGGETARLQGRITGALGGAKPAPVIVRCYSLQVSGRGAVLPLSRHEFFHRAADATCLAQQDRFDLGEMPVGPYAIVAFQDLNGDGEPGYDPCEPLGWHTGSPGGWIEPFRPGAEAVARIRLRRTTPFPAQRRLDGFNGELCRTGGIATLRLWGNPVERGRAHGALVGRQILEFFEFYILEDKFRSAAEYEKTFYPFLQSHFRHPPELITECAAVVDGMRASGLDLRIEALGREFEITDLLAINAYIESRAMRSSCTQFAFWGGRSADGGTIAGRNMDGEIDLRKTTVSHFLVIAVDQRDRDKKRFLNLMWPGFVGTISGINEAGVYSMENAGGTGPGPVVGGLVPCSWIQRAILERAPATIGADEVTAIIDTFRSAGGGSFGPGSIILFATPSRGQRAPAFVYEGDRFGGAMRLPDAVRPRGREHIMAANHHLVYGVRREAPDESFGRTASFSSRWRYEAGMHLLEAFERRGTKIGVPEMTRLLQTVAHGTTEHSIIFRPAKMRLEIAVDDLRADLWDAPYLGYRSFAFADFFGTGDRAPR